MTDALHIAEGYSARPYGDGYIIHHESGGAWAADLAMVAAVREIYSLRAALTQKRGEYEDLKHTMHNMARNHALQLEAARKHEPESVPELRAQLQTLGLWIAAALPTLDTVEPECSTDAELLTALIRRGEMLVLASLARGGALGPNAMVTGA